MLHSEKSVESHSVILLKPSPDRRVVTCSGANATHSELKSASTANEMAGTSAILRSDRFTLCSKKKKMVTQIQWNEREKDAGGTDRQLLSSKNLSDALSTHQCTTSALDRSSSEC